MSIWYKAYSLSELQDLNKGTAGEHLGITFSKIGEDYLEATLPFDHCTQQPYGILHGGASALLIETLASVASSMVIDHDQFITVGTSLQADHLRQVRKGTVLGRARPLHLGRKLHVWKVDVLDENQKLVCNGKLSCLIRPL